ncbi:transposase [Paenibacillus sp. FSL K6-1330]|uniref:transposase n=1 Tax=Paenibacillus sp. FSL K6-1330 TaxID=2975292 RepID=UPI0030D95C75
MGQPRRQSRQLPSQVAHQSQRLRLHTTDLLFSSDIANAVRENVMFMWIAGRQHPDFRTTNRFRSERIKDVL